MGNFKNIDTTKLTAESDVEPKGSREIKTQLNSMLKNAHDNQKKINRFEQIEFKLMSAASIKDVLLILRDDYLKLFKLDACTLILNDQNLSLQRLIPEEFQQASEKNFLSLVKIPFELDKLRYLSPEVTTGTYQAVKHRWLMNQLNIQSIAVLPLIRRGNMIGVFCCGSSDSFRFKKNAASDFLQRLAFIIAVCIENALNLERLTQSSLTDPLTQVHNRRFFDQRLPEELARRDRNQAAISCVFLDIDFFKSVNDNYGHGVGDDVLRQVAKRIQSVLRTHDILARYGGEEFAVLLPETDNEKALIVAQRIVGAVNTTPVAMGKNVILTITISAGVSTLMTQQSVGDSRELGMKLLSMADQALYHAKEQGRNRAINAGLLELEQFAQNLSSM